MAPEREGGEDAFPLGSVIDPKERDRVRPGWPQLEDVVVDEISPGVQIVFCIVVQVPVEDRVRVPEDKASAKATGRIRVIL
jgi:hypothetical protein